MQLFQWIRYFSHISMKKIAGKAAHTIHRKAIGCFPSIFIKTKSANDLFKSESLARFAEIYRCMGERFQDAGSLREGVFTCKGVRKNFGRLEDISWDDGFPGEPEKLHWMHDLAFFSYSIALVESDPQLGVDTTARLVRVLERRHPIGRGRLHFVWSPIALSLRIMGISTAAAIARSQGVNDATPSLRVLADHVAYCAALLDLTAERYLGYNHHVFAATALAVAGMTVGPCRELSRRCVEAAVAIEKHVLDDGFWEERSPTYHIHMLLLADALLAADALPQFERGELQATVLRMRQALATVVHADGEIAVFNDAAIEDSVPPSRVGWQPPESDIWHAVCPQAGYAQLRNRNTSVVFDAGIMGPDDVIGHGHGDFLSVEVCWNGERLIVDPGVRSISGGVQRQHTRSAALHNGPTYERLEPAEFFGTWRVGRRGQAGLDACAPIGNSSFMVSGWCDGYRPYTNGKDLRRTVALHADGTVFIKDDWPSGCIDLKRRVSLLIPEKWQIVRINAYEMLFDSGSNRVKLSLQDACTAELFPEIWCPVGPMRPENANKIVITVPSHLECSIIKLLPITVEGSSAWQG